MTSSDAASDRPTPDAPSPNETPGDAIASDSTPMDACPVEIQGVSHWPILRYFETLNAGQFEATAALFTENGALLPPFADPVVGAVAIAAYLHQEAAGMQLQPHTGEIERRDNTGDVQICVQGRVQTPVFGVNVAWRFVLTPDQKLRSVQVRLLASPQDLLSLRR